MALTINSIDLAASSFPGIAKSTSFGFAFVSTIANVGIFNLCASFTAMCSLITSTMKIADGRRVRSWIEPRSLSSFALCRLIINRSRFDMVAHVPSVSILSIAPIFLIALRMVAKLVSMPPGHLSVTYGMLTRDASRAMIP